MGGSPDVRVGAGEARGLDLWLVDVLGVRVYSTYMTQTHTFQGHAAVMCNADTWTHLARTDTAPGARRSLCAYTATQLREATTRDLNVNPDSTLKRGFCPTCAERAGLFA